MREGQGNMRLWIESEVIFDCLFRRKGYEDSLNVMKICESRVADGYISSVTLLKIMRIVAEEHGMLNASAMINDIRMIFAIHEFRSEYLNSDSVEECDGFDERLELTCARIVGADCIVTNDIGKYRCKDIKVVAPNEVRYMKDKTKGVYYVDIIR